METREVGGSGKSALGHRAAIGEAKRKDRGRRPWAGRRVAFGLPLFLSVSVFSSLFLSFLASLRLSASRCTKRKLFGADAAVIHFADGNSEAR